MKAKQPITDAERRYARQVGSALSALAEERGLSQTVMAERCALDQSTWSRIENGRIVPNAIHLTRAAAVLELQPSEILRRAEAITL